MGWSIGWDSNWNRDIGYGVPAYCDYPGCNVTIDRGLSHVCANEEPYGGSGCGLYFCHIHQDVHGFCERCKKGKEPFTPKPEHPEWIAFKMHDASWARWRQKNKIKRQ